MDGALYYNNPCKVAHHERKAIWPDVSNRHPDLLLSLGTGHNRAATEKGIEEGLKSETYAYQRRNAKRVGKANREDAEGLDGLRRWAHQRMKRPFAVLVSLRI